MEPLVWVVAVCFAQRSREHKILPSRKHYDITSTVNAELKFGAPGLCNWASEDGLLNLNKTRRGPSSGS